MSPKPRDPPPLLSGRKSEKEKNSARSQNDEFKNSLFNAVIMHEEGRKSHRMPPKANKSSRNSAKSYED